MKLTKPQLRKIIKEEIQSLLEQWPPSQTDVADAYADSLTGGSVPTGDEEEPYMQIDRTESPEYDAIVSILDKLHNPETLADPDDGGSLIDAVIAFKKRKSRNPEMYDDPEMKTVFVDRLSDEVSKLPTSDQVPSDAKWSDLERLLHVLQVRMKPTTRHIAKLKGAQKAEAQRLRRQELAAMDAIRTLLKVLQDTAAHPGSTKRGQFGVGKKLNFKNVEDWPELEEPPGEDELEDIGGAVGHARLEEKRNKIMKLPKSQLKKIIKEEIEEGKKRRRE